MEWNKLRIHLINELGPMLVKTKALQFGDFILSSGKSSPYYIDLRVIPSYPDVFDKVIFSYINALENLGVLSDLTISGIPTSGLTYASVISYNLKKPLIYVREKNKSYGTGNMIEGVLKSGSNVVVIDDLITTGGSLITTIDTVRQAGGKVDNVVVLIDRLQGGKKRLADKGVTLNVIMNINELADSIYNLKIINLKQYENIKSQAKMDS